MGTSIIRDTHERFSTGTREQSRTLLRSLGRSGVNWTRVGPVVIDGQNFAAFRIQELFAEKVKAVL